MECQISNNSNSLAARELPNEVACEFHSVIMRQSSRENDNWVAMVAFNVLSRKGLIQAWQ
jgi:hypothetical protein